MNVVCQSLSQYNILLSGSFWAFTDDLEPNGGSFLKNATIFVVSKLLLIDNSIVHTFGVYRKIILLYLPIIVE